MVASQFAGVHGLCVVSTCAKGIPYGFSHKDTKSRSLLSTLLKLRHYLKHG
jgi:hypothetical protein